MVDKNVFMLQEAIDAVVVWDSTKLCTVGFLLITIAAVEKNNARFIGILAQVVKLQHLNKKIMSVQIKRSMKIASFRLLGSIQGEEN